MGIRVRTGSSFWVFCRPSEAGLLVLLLQVVFWDALEVILFKPLAASDGSVAGVTHALRQSAEHLATRSLASGHRLEHSGIPRLFSIRLSRWALGYPGAPARLTELPPAFSESFEFETV